MSKNVNIESGLTKYTFSDASGEVVAYFRMNPTDIRLAQRADKAVEFLQNMAQTVKEQPTTEDLLEYDKQLTDQINFILGYDAAATLFGFMSATTVMGDGKIFAALVLETIAENLKADLESRFEKFKALSKYTAKYE